MESSAPKWTEIEHLPEWDEEFYHVYTAKKYGKWLMLKTLRPELKGQEKYEKMIEKEFEVRYNLAHPHIIMINDYEEVPGVGMCIITDDVYGDSLEKLIREHKVTDEHIYKLHISCLMLSITSSPIIWRIILSMPRASSLQKISAISS